MEKTAEGITKTAEWLRSTGELIDQATTWLQVTAELLELMDNDE